MTVSAGSLLSLKNLLTHRSLSASCAYKLPECKLHKKLASAAPVTYCGQPCYIQSKLHNMITVLNMQLKIYIAAQRFKMMHILVVQDATEYWPHTQDSSSDRN